ncbi:MAG TPA: hypothetical protein GX743_11600, partial [Actinomycetales bacterium]|nr:hypothetical protein [Actinomycetales bacterium]
YAGGASELASGAQLLAGGSGQLADGVVQLADGASASASGAGQLADGTAELADGLGQLWDGTTQLAGGLRDGADEIPVFTAEEARALAATLVRPVAVDDVTTGVMAGPVVEASPRGERVAAWTEFAPTVGAIALWLGALASSLVLEALPARRRFEAGGPVRLAWAGMWPGLVAAVIQAALLVGVLAAFGVRFASWWTVLVVAVVAAASFTALNQGLVAVFGRKVGLVTSLVLGVLQLAVLTTLMPAVAGPAVLQPLAGVLPVGLAADGFTRGVLGGWVTSATTAVVGLAVWGAVGHAMSALGARRRQAIDVSELRAASSGRIAAAGS